jgi:hypothetical protein
MGVPSNPEPLSVYLYSPEDCHPRLALQAPATSGTLPRYYQYPPHSSNSNLSMASSSYASSEATSWATTMSDAYGYATSAGSMATSISDTSDRALAADGNAGAFEGLPCEFIGFGDCNARFGTHEEGSWMHHCILHFGETIPTKLLCWFCKRSFTSSNSYNSRCNNYYQRMIHIHDHFRNEGRTEHHIRPDYQLLKYLRDKNIIDEHMYRRVKHGWREKIPYPGNVLRPVPQVGVFDHDYVPEEQIRRAARAKQVPVDLQKEERRARREKPGHH